MLSTEELLSQQFSGKDREKDNNLNTSNVIKNNNINNLQLEITRCSKTVEVKYDFIWQGLAKTKIFKRFKTAKFKNEIELKHFLSEKHLEYFWENLKFANPMNTNI